MQGGLLDRGAGLLDRGVIALEDATNWALNSRLSNALSAGEIPATTSPAPPVGVQASSSDLPSDLSGTFQIATDPVDDVLGRMNSISSAANAFGTDLEGSTGVGAPAGVGEFAAISDATRALGLGYDLATDPGGVGLQKVVDGGMGLGKTVLAAAASLTGDPTIAMVNSFVGQVDAAVEPLNNPAGHQLLRAQAWALQRDIQRAGGTLGLGLANALSPSEPVPMPAESLLEPETTLRLDQAPELDLVANLESDLLGPEHTVRIDDPNSVGLELPSATFPELGTPMSPGSVLDLDFPQHVASLDGPGSPVPSMPDNVHTGPTIDPQLGGLVNSGIPGVVAPQPLLTGPVSGATPLLTGPVGPSMPDNVHAGPTIDPQLGGLLDSGIPGVVAPTPLLTGPVAPPQIVPAGTGGAGGAGADGASHLDAPQLGAAGVGGGAAGGGIALGVDVFRKLVLGEEIDNTQIIQDTATGAVEGAAGEIGAELVGHGISKAATPIVGAGTSKVLGTVLGGGIVDGVITGVTSTLANADAVERGDVTASQATANVAVDAGVALGAGAAGAAAGAAIGSFVPVAGTAVGAGLGFLAGAGTSIGLSMLAQHSGFSDWAKEGLGDQLGVFEDPLGVMWSGISGTIDGAKTGVMTGAAGGAAMGAIGTGLSGAALGFMAGGPLGALAGGLGGAAIGAGGGALIGGGLGLIPGAGIGMGMGVANGLVDWLLPSADAERVAE